MRFAITCQVLGITSLVSTVSAHFSVTFPYWRGDSFQTQWTYPCGGVDQTLSSKNRTAWPIDGGAVIFKGSHPWAQTYINLGLGNEVTAFTIVLDQPFNQTGNGTVCIPHLVIPEDVRANITEGTNGTIQVIQLSHTGGALYNCADIIFRKDAKGPDTCQNSTGVGEGQFTYPSVTNALQQCAANNSKNSGSGSGNTGDAVTVKGRINVATIVSGLLGALFVGLWL